MSIIEGASVSVKTMSDGTLRLSIDIEPRNAQAAFVLFGAPGRAVALAALKDGAAAVQDPEKPKGGQWAKLAGIWCADPDFCTWLQQNHKLGPIRNHGDASKAIRQLCGIASRVELDHDEMALRTFNEIIRYPFMKWMQASGIQK